MVQLNVNTGQSNTDTFSVYVVVNRKENGGKDCGEGFLYSGKIRMIKQNLFNLTKLNVSGHSEMNNGAFL